MRNRVLFTIIFTIAISIPWCRPAFAIVSETQTGDWPADWPAELETYRKQSRTMDVATGTQEHIYLIEFKDRDDFERAWPAILSVKSPGAPIKLKRRTPLISKNHSKYSRSALYTDEKPGVRIFAPGPPGNETRERDFTGTMLTGPPWAGLKLSPNGFLPEYVKASEQDGKNAWVSARPGDGRLGFYHRARVDLELVVDGNVIDLNRILIPTNTPIIDERWTDKETH